MEGYYTGRISSIDAKHGFVKVTYPQENNIVSGLLPLLGNEYNVPEVGALVATILDEKGEGICLGKIFSYGQPPPVSDGYGKEFAGVKITAKNGTVNIDLGGASVVYRKSTGTLKLSAEKIVLDGYDPT